MTQDKLIELKTFCKKNQGQDVNYKQLGHCSMTVIDNQRDEYNYNVPDLDNCIKQLIKDDVIKNLTNSFILTGDKFYINKEKKYVMNIVDAKNNKGNVAVGNISEVNQSITKKSNWFSNWRIKLWFDKLFGDLKG